MSIYVGTTKVKDISVGAAVDDYSAMRGPCPDGFHIPTYSELTNLINAGTTLGAWTLSSGVGLKTYLKLPPAGVRARSTGNVANQNAIGYYQSCESTGSYQKCIVFSNSSVSLQNGYGKAEGYSIRPFKDYGVKPDSSWTTLYQGTGSAGIFRNSGSGLISVSSDGTTRYTIADKNLGATTVYNSGNALSQANCGNYYQWGNCYGFPFTGSITTSSTTVSVSSYGPGNFYYSSTFITSSGDRSSTSNANLWGATTGKTTRGNTKEVYVGTKLTWSRNFYTKGPCPDGFHVPEGYELRLLKDLGVGIGAWTSTGGDNFSKYLKIPKAGVRVRSTGNVANQNAIGYYYSAGYQGNYPKMIYFASSNITIANGYGKAEGLSIRPFKNIPSTPDSSRTVLYQGSGSNGIYHNPAVGIISLVKDGYVLTIADKNLGATEVWSWGNALSQAKCGKYYQRGNNYGFPYTGSITTSSTKVNASSYGPTNPYSSSTFIYNTSSPYDWSSSNNNNLWGGENGNLVLN